MYSALPADASLSGDFFQHPSCGSLVDLIPDATWILDSQGTITHLNQECLSYTGFQTREALKKSWHELIPPEDLERFLLGWANAPLDQIPVQGLVRIRNASGFRENFVRVTPIKSDEGEILGWFGTCIDVENLRLCNDAVHQLVEDLRNEIQLRKNSQAIVAHELRTPLTALSIQFQLLNRYFLASEWKTSVPEKILSLFQKAENEIRRISRIIDELFDFSLIGSGQMNLNLQPLDLSELLEEIVEKFLPQARTAGCLLDFSPGTGAVGSWDRFRLEQVLSNLLGNAIKYAPGEPIRIVVSTQGDRASVEIQDQGKGIDFADQARIFEPFQRLESSKRKTGLGLGLFISRKIAQAHHGSLRLESSPEKGCRFILTLPTSNSGSI